MNRGRVTRDYQSQYPDPIAFQVGETLTLGRQDDEWPGWVWCTSTAGKSGWAPEQFIERHGEIGSARRNYTARELTVRAGELLDLYELLNGWYWARSAAGETGWVPARNISVLSLLGGNRMDSKERDIYATPYLAVRGAAEAIAFYQRAFGAVEAFRITDPDGRIGHAEIRIGNAPIFISDEYPEIDVHAPKTSGDSPVMIVLEVQNADEVFHQALLAGAVEVRPLQTAPDHSMRNGKLNDPFGHRWMILSRNV